MVIRRLESLSYDEDQAYDSIINLNWVRLMASIAFVAMYTQLFYWLRLFSSLAQYVDLII